MIDPLASWRSRWMTPAQSEEPEDPLAAWRSRWLRDQERERKLRELEAARIGGAAQYAGIERGLADSPDSLGGVWGTGLREAALDIPRSLARGAGSMVGGMAGAAEALSDASGGSFGTGALADELARLEQPFLRQQFEQRPPDRELGTAHQVATEALGQLPQLGIVAATGGASLPILGATAGGQEYRHARDQGASLTQALAAAAVTGTSEALLERYLGDVPLIRRMREEIAGSTGQAIREVLKSAGMEGSEEAAATFIRRIVEESTFSDEGLTDVPGEMLRDFGMGALIGGPMRAGSVRRVGRDLLAPRGDVPAYDSGPVSSIPFAATLAGQEQPAPAVQQPLATTPAFSAPAAAPVAPGARQGAERLLTVSTFPNGVRTRFELVEADEIRNSFDEGFPPELQPRERAERIASEAQIEDYAQAIDPNVLGDAPSTADGAPVVGPDGFVEAGNGRSEAIRRAYAYGKGQGDIYKAWLAENVAQFGIDPAEVAGMKRPVLIRRRLDDVDRRQFAIASNAPRGLNMGEGEQAAIDAKVLTPEVIEALSQGNADPAANPGFIRAFSQGLSPEERGSLMTAEGGLSQAGARRVRAAVMAAAYGDSELVARAFESTDDNTRRAASGMVLAAPSMLRARDAAKGGGLHNLDIAKDVADAVAKLSELRAKKEPVARYLAQQSLAEEEISEESKEILKNLDGEIGKSSARVHRFLERYVELWRAEGDPNQGGLFGPSAPRTKMDLITEAATSYDQQGGLFAEDRGGVMADATVGDRLASRRQRPPRGSEGVNIPMGVRTDILTTPAWRQEGEAPAKAPRWFSLEMPEVIKLYRQLTGLVPEIKRKMHGALGYMDPSGNKGQGVVALLAKYARNPERFAQTVRHEIGHLIDYIGEVDEDGVGERTLARGSVLGRLAVLKRYMHQAISPTPAGPNPPFDRNELRKQAAAAHPASDYKNQPEARAKAIRDTYKKLLQEAIDETGALTLEVAQAEMHAVSQAMRPDLWFSKDPEKNPIPTSIQQYVRTPTELYADFFSLFASNPAEWARLAPKSAAAFAAYMKKKPEVKKVYDELMGAAEAGRETVLDARSEEARAAHAEGARRRAEQALKGQTFMERMIDSKNAIVAMVFEKGGALYRRRNKGKKGSALRAAYDSAIRAFHELSMDSSEAALKYEEFGNLVVKEAEKAGLTWADLSEYAFNRRISDGDRWEYANPLGTDQKAAGQNLNRLKERLGDEKFNAARRIMDNYFLKARKPLIDRMKADRGKSPKLLEKMGLAIDYVRFKPTKYIEEAAGRGEPWALAIRSQKGTFENISDPLLETLLQDVAMTRYLARQKAVKAIGRAAMASGEFQVAPMKFNQNTYRNEPVPPPKGGPLEMLTYEQDGKVVGFYVPKEIAEILERDPEKAGKAANFVNSFFGNRFVRNLYVVMSPAFAAVQSVKDPWNAFRNFGRSSLEDKYGRLDPRRLAPGAHPLEWAKSLYKSASELWPYLKEHLKGNAPGFTADEAKALAARAIIAPGQMVSTQYGGPIDDTAPENAAFALFAARAGYTEHAHKTLVQKPLRKLMDRVSEALKTPSEFQNRWVKLAGWKYLEKMHPDWSVEERAAFLRERVGNPDPHRAGNYKALYDAISIFSNVSKEGLRSSAESFRDNKLGYTMKSVVTHVIPAMIGSLALHGLFDDEEEKKEGRAISDVLRKASEYVRSSYQVVPLGMTDSGKGVMLRIPQDYAGSFIHGLTYRVMNAILDDEIEKAERTGQVSDTLNSLIGMLPFMDLSPGIESIGMMVKGSPVDAFRNQEVLSPREQKVGYFDNWNVLKKRMKAAWNNSFQGLVHFETDINRAEAEGDIISILGFGGSDVAPVLSRFLHITDAGDREREYRAEKAEGAEKADAYIDLDAEIARQFGSQRELSAYQLQKNLRLQGHEIPDDILTRIDRIKKKIGKK